MSKEIIALDLNTLSSVTGGTHHTSGGDPLLTDVGNLASQIKSLTAQTSGFSSTQMFLLMAIALQRQNNGVGFGSNIVYYQGGGCPRRWF